MNKNLSPSNSKRSNPNLRNKGFLLEVSTINRLETAILKAKLRGETIDRSELVNDLILDWLGENEETD